MITVKEVSNKKMQKEFVEFPLKLYKDNPYFVPPLYMDEMSLFKKNYQYYDTCEAKYFNAYNEENKIVGRISAIIQHKHNELSGEKRARFTRFDSINDKEVSRALFKAAIDWVRSKGMNIICGPLGFSDLEREGLLIQGFDYLNTYEEQYNYDYYQELIEDYGFSKEVDWVEYRLVPPAEPVEKLERISDLTMRKFNLNKGKYTKNKVKFINHYSKQIFEALDATYKKLYGVVPFNDKTRKSIILSFKLIINMKYISVVCDEKDNVIAFGIAFPAIGEILQKSGGRLTPKVIFNLLKYCKHPKRIDLGLIGVLPEFQATGVNAIILNGIIKSAISDKIEYFETNLNLEDNSKVQSQWKFFDATQHKRRRSFIKHLD